MASGETDLDRIREEFAVIRRTDIEDGKEAVYEEEPVQVQEVAFVMDRFGYCKVLDRNTLERNRETVETEYVAVLRCMNTDKICLFTDKGNLHQIKVRDIPPGKLREKGVPVDEGDHSLSCQPSDDSWAAAYFRHEDGPGEAGAGGGIYHQQPDSRRHQASGRG